MMTHEQLSATHWPSYAGNNAICADNMHIMQSLPDNCFDVACVDPQFGINAGRMNMGSGKKKRWTSGEDWDNAPPPPEYFAELFRISRYQIIFGANYFVEHLPVSRGWLFWDKGINGDSSFGDGELVYTNFDQVIRKINVRYKGFLGADVNRIHATQKPIELYRQIFKQFVRPGWKVIDTHLGSGSSRIAAFEAGIPFLGIEIDPEKFRDQEERYNLETVCAGDVAAYNATAVQPKIF